jgi:hypothetical protein
MVRMSLLSTVLIAFGALSIDAKAQELSHRSGAISGPRTFYSPSDFYQKGLIYRVQTGQAGFYRLCNDDGLKRYSPYIEWSEKKKQKPGLVPYQVSSLVKDTQRKIIRWNWGKADCGDGNCK